jgi:hypothetical protein
VGEREVQQASQDLIDTHAFYPSHTHTHTHTHTHRRKAVHLRQGLAKDSCGGESVPFFGSSSFFEW